MLHAQSKQIDRLIVILFSILTSFIVSVGCVSPTQRAEDDDWRSVLRRQDIDSHELFIKAYPSSSHIAEAKSRLDDLEFNRAKRLDTSSSYGEYLKRYPEGSHRNAALSALELTVFKEAVSSNTVASYEGFLKSYPGGLHSTEARSRMEKLRSEAEARDYQVARISTSYGVVKAFLESYPESSHAAEIQTRVGMFSKSITTGPLKVSYEEVGWNPPITSAEARKIAAADNSLLSFSGRITAGSHITPPVKYKRAVLVIKDGSRDPELRAGKLRATFLSGGAVKWEALDETGFAIMNFVVLLPEDSEFAIESTRFGELEVTRGTVRLTADGLELLQGAEVHNFQGK